MGSVGKWILGAVVSLVAVIALFFAAKAHDNAIYYTGLGIFIACVLFVMYQVKLAFDEAERSDHK
jgi:UDP-N-acetylmuramyl pentapeptide phosphotransferase/UDP-N-acetylglucosamine-1-phosphate transferase